MELLEGSVLSDFLEAANDVPPMEILDSPDRPLKTEVHVAKTVDEHHECDCRQDTIALIGQGMTAQKYLGSDFLPNEVF